MVSRILLCGVLLRGYFMQIFEDITVEDKFIIVLSFDELSKIKAEAQRSQRLITSIVLDILSFGLEHYKYTTKQCAQG